LPPIFIQQLPGVAGAGYRHLSKTDNIAKQNSNQSRFRAQIQAKSPAAAAITIDGGKIGAAFDSVK